MSDENQSALPSIPPVPCPPLPDSVVKWGRMVRQRNFYLWCWAGGIVTELLIFPLMSIEALKYPALGAMGALTVVWFGGGCAALQVQSQLTKLIRQTLQSQDVTHLGWWIDVLLAPSAVFSRSASAATFYADVRTKVLEQLPLLTEETASLLHDSERRVLYSTLKGQDAELIPVVLRAVHVLGDTRALPFVRHLAKGKGLAAKNPELQAEARSTLNQLQAILDLSNGSQGLLRASHAPQPPDEQLLQPVQGNHETHPRELLRPDVQK